MNLEKVVFGFFIILSMTLNFGFFVGDLTDPNQHEVYELFAAIVVNLVATVLKFGDRTQVGAIQLAASLAAILQLVAGALIWTIAGYMTVDGVTPRVMASIVSLAGGAFLANVVSVILLLADTIVIRR
jgi:putative Ca2+/H+ antiporter (TMEM165/GDT1 family)